jgi:hypothetical protein
MMPDSIYHVSATFRASNPLVEDVVLCQSPRRRVDSTCSDFRVLVRDALEAVGRQIAPAMENYPITAYRAASLCLTLHEIESELDLVMRVEFNTKVARDAQYCAHFYETNRERLLGEFVSLLRGRFRPLSRDFSAFSHTSPKPSADVRIRHRAARPRGQ